VKSARALSVVAFVVGLAARVAPLVQGPALLLRQPTEDGYLVLAIARNMAIGLGMSTAAGTIATNGVQPLVTGLDAICFLLAGGDKTRGVAYVMWLSVLIAVLSFLAVRSVGRVLFARLPGGRDLAGLGAALWFASPLIVTSSMNALETGVYFLTLALSLRYFLVHASDPDTDLDWKRAGILGLLLGVTFWARNDAIFLAIAMAATRVGGSLGRPAPVIKRRILELSLAGFVMALVGAPWMIHNALRFGSIVPISGRAEAALELGKSLPFVPAKLAELVTVVGAIPNALEEKNVVRAASLGLVLLAVAAAVRAFRGGSTTARTAIGLGLVHATLLAGYYGVFSGAPHFLARYLAPISILTAFFTLAVVLALLADRPARLAIPALMALVAFGLDARLYRKSHEHMHFQVVDYVAANVPPESWVGAIQSGTLGFFHDRTINLDGKTNLAALEARLAGKTRDYVLSSNIQYIADWVGMASWIDWLKPDFTLVVDDPAKNLAVLRRVR
jgi:hypothetical protein